MVRSGLLAAPVCLGVPAFRRFLAITGAFGRPALVCTGSASGTCSSSASNPTIRAAERAVG